MNYAIFFLTALIPFVIHFLWYSPISFMKPWLRTSGLRKDDLSKGRMGVVFLLTYLLSCMLTAALVGIVIHQTAIGSIMQQEPGIKDPNSEISKFVQAFMARYGNNFRTFKHGAFHGTLSALFFALPVLGINALFERKRFSYVAIHTGYWIVTLALMGGVICQFLKLS